MVDVEVRNVHGAVTAIGSAGPFTVVIDRPREAGGGGLGLNGGELLHLAVAVSISNDLFREADRLGIALTRVVVTAGGDFAGDPVVSSGITYRVDVSGDAGTDQDVLRDLVRLVDRIAEIPNSLRRGTDVLLTEVTVVTATRTATTAGSFTTKRGERTSGSLARPADCCPTVGPSYTRQVERCATRRTTT